LGDYVALITFVPLLRQIRKKYRPDITHVHWVDCHALYCIQANLHPLVLSVWGSDVNNCFESNADIKHNQKMGFILSNAEKVIVDSAEMLGKCSALANKNLKNTELLHLGINPQIFSFKINESVAALKQQFNIPLDSRVILSVRAFAPLYQHEKILAAFAQVLPNLRRKTVLVLKRFNESNNKYYVDILTLIKQLGIENSICWLGQVPDARIPDLYHIIDLIINFPSQDTFPITFLEAAASEKPLITNYLPSYENTFARDFFRIVDDGSIARLAQSIYEELEVAPTPQDKLQAAHRMVEKDFDEKHYMNRLVEIYTGLESENKTREDA
jgi:glycosyltransferase involved in cell wall biosynthesis